MKELIDAVNKKEETVSQIEKDKNKIHLGQSDN